jgi:ribosome-associated toxin RatA of RatAB toxin-antitoxin module
MRTSESVVVPAGVSVVFPHVARLEAYPSWLRLVHDVELVQEHPRPAWEVELRARVGPFARSKRLRMERTELVEHRLAVFERAETDARQHAAWTLRAELMPHDDGASTTLTMHLAYEGSLWSGAILGKVLDEEIKRARQSLVTLVTSGASDHGL